MNKMVYIYSLKDPRDYQIKYIGKASDVNKRYKQHIENYTNQKSLKSSWVLSILRSGLLPILEIVEICDESKWQEREQYWIKYYKELGFDLKNMTNGGDGNTGLKMSDISKEKIRRANLGKKSSKEKITKISNWAKGNNKIQKNLKLGSKKSQIPIIQKSKDGEVINQWDSLQQASDELGIERSNISHCLRGRIKTSGGYIWEYVRSSNTQLSMKSEAQPIAFGVGG